MQLPASITAWIAHIRVSGLNMWLWSARRPRSSAEHRGCVPGTRRWAARWH